MTSAVDVLPTVLGYRADGSPVHPVMGAAEPEPEDVDNTAEDDATEELLDEEFHEDPADVEDDADEQEPAYTHTQADIDRLKAAYTKRTGELKARNRALAERVKAHEQRIQATASEGDEKTARALEEARAEVESRYKPLVVRTAAKAAFLTAGIATSAGDTDTKVSRLIRLLNLDDIEIDEDGDVLGLDDQVDQLKDTFPELFQRAKEPEPVRKVRAPKGDTGAKTATPPKPKTIGEMVAARVHGQR